MYNYNDNRFLGSSNLSCYSLTNKRVSPFRGGLDTNFSQLPAIKEEDGLSSEEESEVNTKSIYNVQSFTTFPSLNINCLMNIEIKQSHSIWNTNFGKRLINQNSFCEILSEPYITEISFLKKTYKKRKPTTFVRKKFFRDSKNGKEDKKKFCQTSCSIEKSEKFKKENQNTIKENMKKESVTTIPKINSIEKSSELSQETSTATLNSKPQILTEFVRSIFENCSEEFGCDRCNEIFSDIEELNIHQKQHELEKETCLLCEKVFYDSSKFAQHLLTHEGVDRFSCKKCMKYFPSAKKYKEHIQEVHFKPPPIITYFSPPKVKYEENCLPKYECKRCKLELDSEKSYKKHKRAHFRKNLMRAYLLNQEYVKASSNIIAQ